MTKKYFSYCTLLVKALLHCALWNSPSVLVKEVLKYYSDILQFYAIFKCWMCPSLAPTLEESTPDTNRRPRRDTWHVFAVQQPPGSAIPIFHHFTACTLHMERGAWSCSTGPGLGASTWLPGGHGLNVQMFLCSFWKYEIFICSLKKIFTNKIAIVN